jgi:hypothetical protein
MELSYQTQNKAVDQYGIKLPDGIVLTVSHSYKYGTDPEEMVYGFRDYRAEREYRVLGSWILSHPSNFIKTVK